ncbi:TPA: Lar family restriction alleviation protein [Pseudomonas aeruginosa]|uniref:Lar family restriction alleviation protein n=1 Tax=Pseudomonas aeruginosa TaxID=287 RepID=UPI0024B3CA5E|nr:Lar family restriction alleviation protein [Pseudomonas aeruginosa]EKF7417474.1 Lar family restriction alleviation protein [Pseudomonas aeruginosa]CAI9794706.1 Lar family restriction alleviation protein [Pseudomonas aeruginosa]CAI9912095.1 Lar family restriction alleviation protein [Pseudomonas aeruginosa]HBO1620013.1 Lar family restriction alleviation protein [Pseudomonas aeruginosa]HCA5868372.1 Lar family restriction alleviation protein [Pseudomonas aeruginosa]
MSVTLCDCPFCGSDRIGIHFKKAARKSGFQAMCLQCRVGQTRTFYSSIERAAEAWNTRAFPRPENHGIAIPVRVGISDDASQDLVPCTGIPKGWGVYAEGDQIFLVKVGEHGGACWTVSYRKGSGLYVEEAAAQFLESVLVSAVPIAATSDSVA